MKNILMPLAATACFAASALQTHSQDCTYPKVDQQRNFTYRCPGNLTITEKIDGNSIVSLISDGGFVWDKGKIDGHSIITISAPNGACTIGDKIDGSSTVTINCLGDIIVGDKIDGSSQCDFNSANGHVHIMGKIDNSGTLVRFHSPYPIQVDGGINGNARVVAY